MTHASTGSGAVRAKNLTDISMRDRVENSGDLIAASAEVSEAISTLPAVATLDWCDRAAGALTHIPRVALSGVFICTVEENGRIADLEAVGFAAGAYAKAPPSFTNDLRYRAERVDNVGWIPGPSGALFSPSLAATLSSLPGGSHWKAGPIGRLLGDLAGNDVVIGAAPMGVNVRGRALIALLTPGDHTAEPSQEIIQFTRVFVPILARRALMAIGPSRSKRNQWLSPREQVVLEMLTLGLSVRQIADELKRSPHTVHDHVKALHRKLGASSRGELVARALGHVGGTEAPTARMAKAELLEQAIDSNHLTEPKIDIDHSSH